jgi:transposase
MRYLGIDIGKNTHVASLMDEKGKTLFKAFSFSNTSSGGESLLKILNDFISSPADVQIGMEATGHYWLSVYSFLVEHNFLIHVVNPIQTDGWRKGTEIRKRKTDIIDSLLIADLIRYGDFLEASLADEDTLSLRNLSRFRNYLVGSISDLKRKTICVLDQIFPEYASVFSNIFGQTSKEILKNFSLLSDFEDITSEQLNHVLSEIKLKKFAITKLNKLSDLSSQSFGVKFALDSFQLQLKLLVEQIDFIDKQVDEIEAEMSYLVDKMNSPLLTIPGIGPITGATILGEIGDIERFSSPAKLVAYAGIDASVSQSGEFTSSNNRMSKRGSPYLRKAIFQASLIASNHDPVFKAYYQKKRSEGKHHLTALGAVSRKLCYTIHAILKNKIPYEVQLPIE